jgi:outer membrane receptor for ferrienterochelin and colicin
MQKIKAGLMLFFICILSVAAGAQESQDAFENLLFMDLPIGVASLTTQKESEAPAVLTVITREEIQNSGARGLKDILSMVPGFVPGEDVQGVQGYGVGGVWSMEGKMLVMIDGVQMNDILYGNPLFGASSFVDYIDHIEIIRGPGSAIYGGFGELAVVNIITRNASTPGTSVSTMYGQMAGTYGHRSLNVCSSGETDGVKISVNAAVGDGQASDRDFTNASGQTFSMKDFSENDSWFADIGLGYKDFMLKIIADSYVVHSVANGNFNNTLNIYDPGINFPLETKFTNYAVDSKYKIKLGDNFFITPRVTYIESEPWRMDNTDPVLFNDYYLYIQTRQVKLNATAEYDFNEKTNLTLGAEFSSDEACSKGLAGQFSNGAEKEVYDTGSVFAEFRVKTDIANFTAGARYDRQSQFGGAFAPRLAITKTLGDFNLKGLISRAYRAPTILDISYNSGIKPEYTNTIQAEASYMITKNKSVALDVFDTRIQDVIVYDANAITYNNFGKTGTQGIDLSYKMNEFWGYLNISYSYYQVIDNGVPDYAAANTDGSVNSRVLLGFPASKASLSSSYNAWKNISINPSILYFGQRYTTYWSNSAGTDVNQILDPVTLVNINIRAKEVAKNLEISLGVYNVFDTAYDFAPGYYQVQQPTPSYSREYTAKLTYNF